MVKVFDIERILKDQQIRMINTAALLAVLRENRKECLKVMYRKTETINESEDQKE